MNRTNPNVSSFLEESVFTQNNVLNFRDKNIRFAFAVEGFFDKELKDDPRFVKGFARFYGHLDGKGYEKLFPYHKCTEEDFKEFAPPTPEAEVLLEVYKYSSSRALYCLDWERYGGELAIWGVEHEQINY